LGEKRIAWWESSASNEKMIIVQNMGIEPGLRFKFEKEKKEGKREDIAESGEFSKISKD